MTPEQQRITFAICLSVGFTFLISAGLTFLIRPMAEDLHLGDGTVGTLLALPSIASLLIIFIAGQTGDCLGHRVALLYFSVAFIVGSALIALGNGAIMVGVGLAICGAAATAIQIVALGLLQLSVPDGRAHTSAFTTYGMVYPVAYLAFPLLTAGLLNVAAWRLIPILWAVAGLVVSFVVLRFVRHAEDRQPMGEWLSPLLAGAVLAAGVRFLATIRDDGFGSREAITDVAIFFAAILLLTWRYGASHALSFSLEPLREVMVRALLIGVALVALAGTLTYVILALEYMYNMTPLDAAVAVIPAQAGAIVGAKIFASRAIQRWGYADAGTHLTLALGVSMLTMVSIQASSPAWLLIACATVFNTAALAAVTVLNADVMARAPQGATGPISSFRGAASSIGTGLGVVVLGTGVINAANVSDGASNVGSDQLHQIASALRLDGILGCGIALIAWITLRLTERQRADSIH